jgi:hypothetical protein
MWANAEQRPALTRLGVCLVALAWLVLQVFPLLPTRSYAATAPGARTFCSKAAFLSGPSGKSHQHGVCSATACNACACVSLSFVDRQERRFEPPVVAFSSWRRVDQSALKATDNSYFRARGPPLII